MREKTLSLRQTGTGGKRLRILSGCRRFAFKRLARKHFRRALKGKRPFFQLLVKRGQKRIALALRKIIFPFFFKPSVEIRSAHKKVVQTENGLLERRLFALFAQHLHKPKINLVLCVQFAFGYSVEGVVFQLLRDAVLRNGKVRLQAENVKIASQRVRAKGVQRGNVRHFQLLRLFGKKRLGKALGQAFLQAFLHLRRRKLCERHDKQSVHARPLCFQQPENSLHENGGLARARGSGNGDVFFLGNIQRNQLIARKVSVHCPFTPSFSRVSAVTAPFTHLTCLPDKSPKSQTAENSQYSQASS